MTQDQLQILDRYVEYKIEARIARMWGDAARAAEAAKLAERELAKLQTKPLEQEDTDDRN